MRKTVILTLTVTALIFLTGCTQLSSEDRALLVGTQNLAREARDRAAQAAMDAEQASKNAAVAAEEAAIASQEADVAAGAAQAASEKANRIFQKDSDK